MLRRISSLILVLFSCSVWAQHPYTSKAEEATIERVKTLQVSSLDRDLPKVTLEFFLKYEGDGAPIKWRMSNCDQLKRNPVTERQRDPTTCVEAEVDLKDKLLASMKEHGKEKYFHAGVSIEVVNSKDKVRVRINKDGE